MPAIVVKQKKKEFLNAYKRILNRQPFMHRVYCFKFFIGRSFRGFLEFRVFRSLFRVPGFLILQSYHVRIDHVI